MSGQLILKQGGKLKTTLLTLLIVAGVTLLVMVPAVKAMERRGVQGGMGQIYLAIIVPLLIWAVWKIVAPRISRGDAYRTLDWAVEGAELRLGEARIPLKQIKMVHCWHKDGSWTINIETTGKNYLLASAQGAEAERAAQRMYDLVDALGYRARWREAEQQG